MRHINAHLLIWPFIYLYAFMCVCSMPPSSMDPATPKGKQSHHSAPRTRVSSLPLSARPGSVGVISPKNTNRSTTSNPSLPVLLKNPFFGRKSSGNNNNNGGGGGANNFIGYGHQQTQPPSSQQQQPPSSSSSSSCNLGMEKQDLPLGMYGGHHPDGTVAVGGGGPVVPLNPNLSGPDSNSASSG